MDYKKQVLENREEKIERKIMDGITFSYCLIKG